MARSAEATLVRTALVDLVLGDDERGRAAATRLSQAGHWPSAVALSVQWRVTPWLAARVVEAGLAVPDPAALRERATALAAQSAWVCHGAAEVLASLGGAGLTAVAFKGVGTIAALYRSPGLRVATDVDVLVPPHEVPAIRRHLLGLGYAEFKHLPGAEDADGVVPLDNVGLVLHGDGRPDVDLHWRIGLTTAAADYTAGALHRARPADLVGTRMLAAAPVDAVLLAADHAARNGLNLSVAVKDLVDVAAWCRSADLDPAVLASTAAAAERLVSLFGVLEAIRRRDPVSVVDAQGAVGAALGADARQRANRLADVLDRQLALGHLETVLLRRLALAPDLRSMLRPLPPPATGPAAARAGEGSPSRGRAPTRTPAALARRARAEAGPGRLADYVAVLRAQADYRPRPPGWRAWRAAALDRLPRSAWDVRARLRAVPRPGAETARASQAATPTAGGGGPQRYLEHLARDIVPFWLAHGVDPAGGFLTNLDRAGCCYDPNKDTVTQARMVFAFSATAGRYADPEAAGAVMSAAASGAAFLLDRMWDGTNGGWFQRVTRYGEVIAPTKRLWDQAFAILGLAQHALVSRDQRALDRAVAGWRTVERHAWDGERSGYHESCTAGWEVASPLKTLCIHLDMLEALHALSRLAGDLPGGDADLVAERVAVLGELVVTRLHDDRHGCLVEKCDPAWRYVPRATSDVAQIGHQLKAAEILARLHREGAGPDHGLDLARALVDYSLRHGWDGAHGGFFQFVHTGGSLADPVKEWWPQCEGIAALAAAHALTADHRYADHLAALERFAFTHFADPEYGEWYTQCEPDGTVRDANKGSWRKAAYHTVRMCLETHRWLTGSGAGPP